MKMNVHSALAENTEYLMKARSLTQQRVADAGGLSQRSVSNARNKTRDLQISTIAGLAKAFKLPPWVMLLPNEELKQYAQNGALDFIQNYFSASPHGREIIAAVAESHSKPHRNNPSDDPPEK